MADTKNTLPLNGPETPVVEKQVLKQQPVIVDTAIGDDDDVVNQWFIGKPTDSDTDPTSGGHKAVLDAPNKLSLKDRAKRMVATVKSSTAAKTLGVIGLVSLTAVVMSSDNKDDANSTAPVVASLLDTDATNSADTRSSRTPSVDTGSTASRPSASDAGSATVIPTDAHAADAKDVVELDVTELIEVADANATDADDDTTDAIDVPVTANTGTNEPVGVSPTVSRAAEAPNEIPTIRGADLSTVRSFAGQLNSLIRDASDLTSLVNISAGQTAIVVTERDGLFRRTGANASAQRGNTFARGATVTLTGESKTVNFIEVVNGIETTVPAKLVGVEYNGTTVYLIAGHLQFVSNSNDNSDATSATSTDASPSLPTPPVAAVAPQQAATPDVARAAEVRDMAGTVPVVDEYYGATPTAAQPRVSTPSTPTPAPSSVNAASTGHTLSTLVQMVINAGDDSFIALEHAKIIAQRIAASSPTLSEQMLVAAERGSASYAKAVHYANLLTQINNGTLPVGEQIQIGNESYRLRSGNRRLLSASIRQEMRRLADETRHMQRLVMEYAASVRPELDVPEVDSIRSTEFRLPNIRRELRNIRHNAENVSTDHVSTILESPETYVGRAVSYTSARSGSRRSYVFRGLDARGNIQLSPANNPKFLFRVKPENARQNLTIDVARAIEPITTMSADIIPSTTDFVGEAAMNAII